MMRNKFKTGVLLILAGLLSIVSAGGILLYNRQNEMEAADASLEVAEELLTMINEASPSNSSGEGLESLPEDDENKGAASTASIEENSGENSEESPSETEASENTSGGGDYDSSYIVVDNTAYLGVLNIPKFGLSLPVNMDWSYPALKRTPCRYSGSIARNSLVIAAHNYNTHFGRVTELNPGDIVSITDAEGNEFEYSMVSIETVNPEDSYNVVRSEYDLTLFTCTYSGQARVVVRFERMQNEE